MVLNLAGGGLTGARVALQRWPEWPTRVDQLYSSAGALIAYMRETALVLARLPEDAPLRQTFRNDVYQLVDDLGEILDAMDDATDEQNT